MDTKKFIRKLLPLLVVLLLSTSSISFGNVTPPWSSTFNCADWTQGQAFNCDGIDLVNSGNYSSCTNHPDTGSSVYAVHNNPLGTAKGFRQIIMDGYSSTASPRITFTPSQTELWIRWYVRYELGFNPNLGYQKYAYIYFSGGSKVFDILTNNWSLTHQGCDAGGTEYGTGGFAAMNGGSTGDGNWHCIEIHIKKDTGANDGVFEAWIDGVQVMSVSKTSYCNTNITSVHFGVNQDSPLNYNCGYFDYDDFEVRNTGYIGPLGNPAAPSSPKNLRIIP